MDFVIGKGIVHGDGADVTIISTGTVLHRVRKAAELLEEEGIHATVIDMHTIQPIDQELIRTCAEKTGAILTVEEHSIYGGLGSAVAEVLAQDGQAILDILGMEDFAESGDLNQLMDKYGYSPEHIAERAKKLMEKKER